MRLAELFGAKETVRNHMRKIRRAQAVAARPADPVGAARAACAAVGHADGDHSAGERAGAGCGTASGAGRDPRREFGCGWKRYRRTADGRPVDLPVSLPICRSAVDRRQRAGHGRDHDRRRHHCVSRWIPSRTRRHAIKRHRRIVERHRREQQQPDHVQSGRRRDRHQSERHHRVPRRFRRTAAG